MLAGMVGYVLAVDEGHWWATEIVGRDCKPFEAGDNCSSQVLIPGPDYVPHGTYGWLGWLALFAFVAGFVPVVAAILRAGAFRQIIRGASGHGDQGAK
jgi:hypothetical protein